MMPLKGDNETESSAHARETPTQENVIEPEKKLVKAGLRSKIWGFLRRPTTTFRAVKEETLRSALKYALICLVIFGALTGIMLALLGSDELSGLELGGRTVKLLLIAGSIGLSIAGGMILIFISGSWTHLWVKLLGERKGCSYRQTLKALAYGATPAYLVGWVPLVMWSGDGPIGATVLIGALISIWALVVTIIGLRELHGITTGRAVLVSLLGIVITGLVILLVAVVGAVLLVIEAFFFFFGGG
jgi:hypothetical protein